MASSIVAGELSGCGAGPCVTRWVDSVCRLEGRPEGRNLDRRARGQVGREEGRKEGRKKGRKEGRFAVVDCGGHRDRLAVVGPAGRSL